MARQSGARCWRRACCWRHPSRLFYDLILCSLSAAWLARAARRDGWLPGEGISLMVLLPVQPACRGAGGASASGAVRRFGGPRPCSFLPCDGADGPDTGQGRGRSRRKKAQPDAFVKNFIASSIIKV